MAGSSGERQTAVDCRHVMANYLRLPLRALTDWVVNIEVETVETGKRVQGVTEVSRDNIYR